jgi:type VI secretion system protein ImpL
MFNFISKIRRVWTLLLKVVGLGKGLQKTKETKGGETVDTIKLELSRTIDSIKDSKLARGASGSPSMYALPWYMFVGAPGAGKSTLIRNSGLDFSYLDIPDSGSKGKDGTRNFDWWFTKHSILLDTAGRYVTEDETRPEWNAFIEFLKENREEKPIDGVIIAVNISAIQNLPEEELEWYANRLRAHVDEMIKRLSLIFPIYLIFTYCDQIQGFDEFFDQLDDRGRSQVWGCTLTAGQQEDPRPESVFEKEFEKLYRNLKNLRLFQLPKIESYDARHLAYIFPLALARLRPKLSRFVGLLFQHNPYKENPLFRGFYFVSAAQEVSSDKRPKSYFIKDLFTEIIFPDKDLIAASRPRRSVWTKTSIAAVCLLFVCLIAFGFSFFGNKKLIKGIGSSVDFVNSARSDKERIQGLEKMRERLAELDRHNAEGVPVRLGLGLYRGHEFNTPLRNAYFANFEASLLSPAGVGMERRIQQLLAKAERGESICGQVYPLLHAYLMLTNPSKKVDSAFLFPYMHEITAHDVCGVFSAKPLDEALDKALSNQINFYLTEFGKSDLPYHDRNDSLIKKLQSYLDESPHEKIYCGIKATGEKLFGHVSLKTIMEGRVNNTLLSDYEFSGIYTRKGWNVYVKDAISNMAGMGKAYQQDGVQVGQITEQVEKLYFQDFVLNWKGFLASISLKKFEDLKEAASVLEELSNSGSPAVHLFGEFTQNTTKINEKGRGKRTPLDVDFRTLHEILDTRGKLVDRYLAEISNLQGMVINLLNSTDPGTMAREQAKGHFTEDTGAYIRLSWNTIQELLLGIDEDNRKIVRRLFELPFENVWSVLLKQAQENIYDIWLTQVCKHFNERLKKKYPFNPNGEDATFREIADFFHPESGMFSEFYREELEPFVDCAEGRLQPKKWLGRGIELPEAFYLNVSRGKAISEGLFTSGKPELMIPFEIYPVPIPKVTQILLIIDNEKFDYRNQPQMWNKILWPSKGQNTGVSITIIGAGKESKQYDGQLGFLRFLDDAQITHLEGRIHQISLQVGRFDLNYRVRTKGEGDIFGVMKDFSDFTCYGSAIDSKTMRD